MFKYTKKGMRSVINAVGKLENVGARAATASRTMAVGSGRASKVAAPIVGTTGRALSAMGRNPYATVAGAGVAASGMYGMNAFKRSVAGPMVGDSTRQNTMYNRRMRSGQSTALSGLQPKSMGGYA